MRTIALARAVAVLLTAAAATAAAGKGEDYSVDRTRNYVLLKAPAGGTIVRYLYGKLPAGEPAPAVEGSCYTHPLTTPLGEVVTDLAPPDHPHHRGVFCAWVKLEGEKPGDWWGWGALAPKEQRIITNRSVHTEASQDQAVLQAGNVWTAEGTPVVTEQVTITARQSGVSNVVDYEYRFGTPTGKPVVLAANPFGGFCYRARPRGPLEITGPDGAVDHPDSVAVKPETDWPASHWYDFTYRQRNGKTNGVALMDHPQNPPTRWHIVRPIHMLNPCIVADGPVTIRPGHPLVLRYRLVAHDGPAAAAHLPDLYTEFAK